MEAQVCQVCKSKYYEDENENLGLLDVCKSCNLNEKEEQVRLHKITQVRIYIFRNKNLKKPISSIKSNAIINLE